MECRNTNISKFVDYHLQLIVKNIPSYVQDSNDFLNQNDTAKNIPADGLLVTMDVKSLYTNIPSSEGISAVKAAYKSYPKKSVATKVINTFLALILTLNNVMLNCKISYKQDVWQRGKLVPQVMQTSLWQNLNRNISTYLLKAQQIYV